MGGKWSKTKGWIMPHNRFTCTSREELVLKIMIFMQIIVLFKTERAMKDVEALFKDIAEPLVGVSKAGVTVSAAGPHFSAAPGGSTARACTKWIVPHIFHPHLWD